MDHGIGQNWAKNRQKPTQTQIFLWKLSFILKTGPQLWPISTFLVRVSSQVSNSDARVRSWSWVRSQLFLFKKKEEPYWLAHQQNFWNIEYAPNRSTSLDPSCKKKQMCSHIFYISKPPILIRSHYLHAGDIRGAGETLNASPARGGLESRHPTPLSSVWLMFLLSSCTCFLALLGSA